MSSNEWLAARKSFLEKEKEMTRAQDALTKERQKLPMVPLDKSYQFTAPDGSKKSLLDLFEGRRQLIVYHFMFGPDATEGCHGCSVWADNLPHLSHIRSRDTTVAVVSRAPVDALQKFQKRMGWTFPWYSSLDSDFNFDFHVSMDAEKVPVSYNYLSETELREKGLNHATAGEQPGLSCFLRGAAGEGEQKDGVVYHTYSTFARGSDVGTMHGLLDLTPLGRQDEKYPYPMYYKLHDEYDQE